MIKYLYEKGTVVHFHKESYIKSIFELETILKNPEFKVISMTKLRKRKVLIILGETNEEILFVTCSLGFDEDVQELYIENQDLSHKEDMIKIFEIYKLTVQKTSMY